MRAREPTRSPGRCKERTAQASGVNFSRISPQGAGDQLVLERSIESLTSSINAAIEVLKCQRLSKSSVILRSV